jgi:hypothetical protein
MSFLSSFANNIGKSAATGYNQLRGPTGAPQNASETIDKLCDRLANGTLVEDRRAALLSLKGLSRDWKGVRRTSSSLLLFSGAVKLMDMYISKIKTPRSQIYFES